MRFWELRVPGTPETVEALTNFLWELGALGVVEEESPGGPPALRAFYPEAASSTRLARALTEYRAALEDLGFPLAAGEPEVRALLEEAWASAWQTSFPPRAGRRAPGRGAALGRGRRARRRADGRGPGGSASSSSPAEPSAPAITGAPRGA